MTTLSEARTAAHGNPILLRRMTQKPRNLFREWYGAVRRDVLARRRRGDTTPMLYRGPFGAIYRAGYVPLRVPYDEPVSFLAGFSGVLGDPRCTPEGRIREWEAEVVENFPRGRDYRRIALAEVRASRMLIEACRDPDPEILGDEGGLSEDYNLAGAHARLGGSLG